MSIEQELIQYDITSSLVKLFITNKKFKLTEYINCLERWVLSLAARSGACIYYKTDITDIINKKLVDELKEKKLPSLINQILSTVNKGLYMPIPIIINNNTTSYNNKEEDTQGWIINITVFPRKTFYINIPMSKQKYNILQKFTSNPDCITIMLLRYSTLINKGQQWALPDVQFKYLFENYGINHEGFSSPLNSGLLGCIKGKFCSLFNDTDFIFGSIGSFFDQTLYYKPSLKEKEPNHWIINPPFIESMIERVSNKIVKELEIAYELGIEIMVIYVLPSWSDCAGYIKIRESKFLKKEKHLEKKKHFYEHVGKKNVVNSRSTVFILDTYKILKDYTGILDPMILK
jgi:hypothetical protein